MNSEQLLAALAVARDAAAAAAEVLRHYWQCGVSVELKADATPVTSIAVTDACKSFRTIKPRDRTAVTACRTSPPGDIMFAHR